MIQQLTKTEIKQVSGGTIDGEMLFLGISGIFGGVMGAYFAPMIAPNAATQIMMVMPLSITGGVVLGVTAAGVILASVY